MKTEEEIREYLNKIRKEYDDYWQKISNVKWILNDYDHDSIREFRLVLSILKWVLNEE